MGIYNGEIGGTSSGQAFGLAALERIALYRWLGRIFQRECDSGALLWHRSAQGQAFLSSLAAHPPFAAGAKLLIGALNADSSIEDTVFHLAGDFSSLFHGIDPVRAAPPYESHYAEDSGRLFGEATARMQDILAQNGLNIVGFSEPADHIAVHLQLMAHFAENAAGHDPASPAAGELNRAQYEFLRDHLRNWTQDFADDCMHLDQSGLYAGAAMILVAFLDEEFERLQAPPS